MFANILLSFLEKNASNENDLFILIVYNFQTLINVVNVI